MDNIFEKATKQKLRFSTTKGEISVEELWDFDLLSLDRIAIGVNTEIKKGETESFIGRKSRTSTVLNLKLDILKSIIATKQDEDEKSKAKAEKRQQIDFLEKLAEKKKLDKLEGMDLEEIEKRLAGLREEEAV